MDKQTNIVSAQVVDVKSNKITLKTEEDEVIEVARPKSAAHDMLFIQTMKDILKSGIWIPVIKNSNNFYVTTGLKPQSNNTHFNIKNGLKITFKTSIFNPFFV